MVSLGSIDTVSILSLRTFHEHANRTPPKFKFAISDVDSIALVQTKNVTNNKLPDATLCGAQNILEIFFCRRFALIF